MEHCSIVDCVPDKKEIFIAFQAVYFYMPDERGICLAFEGEKLHIHWFRNYLVVVSRETKAVPRAGM